MPFIISSEYGDNNQCRRGPCAGYDTREDSNDLQIVIEALKIEKVSRHRLVRLWFLLLFAVAAATYLTMPKNMNVIVYREQLLQFLLTREAFPFPPREFFDAIIRKAFLIAVSMYFLLLYAVSWVDSQLYKTTVRPMFGDEMPTETGDSLEENRPASRLKGLHYLKFLTLALFCEVCNAFLYNRRSLRIRPKCRLSRLLRQSLAFFSILFQSQRKTERLKQFKILINR
jgi:hypothetical protein